MNSNDLTIGGRIREQREKCSLTQAELAKKLMVKRETVNQWENDARMIKGDDIARLADALDTNCDYLLRGVSTNQLHFFRDLGLSGQTVQILKRLKPDGPFGSAVLNDFLSNSTLCILLGRWSDYATESFLYTDRKEKFIKLVEKTEGTKVKDSDDGLIVLANMYLKKFNGLVPPQFFDLLSAAEELLKYSDRKSYCLYKLHQAIDAMVEESDETKKRGGRKHNG